MINSSVGSQEQPLGNTLSRRVLGGEDLQKLVDTFRIGETPTYWDVSIPTVDNRPVIDRSRIVPGEVQKARGHLGIATNADKSQLSITVTNPYKSRYDTTPKKIGLPLIGDVKDSIFSPDPEPNVYSGLAFDLDSSGKVSFSVVDEDGAPTPVFEGNDTRDPEYEHMMSFARRMLIIPFHEGPRRPVVPGVEVTPLASS